jgi:hypothetical protein
MDATNHLAPLDQWGSAGWTYHLQKEGVHMVGNTNVVGFLRLSI